MGPMLFLLFSSLVFQGIQRCGHAAAAMGEYRASMFVYRHDWRISEQASEVELVANLLANSGNKANCGGFVVDHANSAFIDNDAKDGFDAGVSWDGDHVEANGANAGHGFKLFQTERTRLCCANHAGIFRYGDKGT